MGKMGAGQASVAGDRWESVGVEGGCWLRSEWRREKAGAARAVSHGEDGWPGRASTVTMSGGVRRPARVLGQRRHAGVIGR